MPHYLKIYSSSSTKTKPDTRPPRRPQAASTTALCLVWTEWSRDEDYGYWWKARMLADETIEYVFRDRHGQLLEKTTRYDPRTASVSRTAAVEGGSAKSTREFRPRLAIPPPPRAGRYLDPRMQAQTQTQTQVQVQVKTHTRGVNPPLSTAKTDREKATATSASRMKKYLKDFGQEREDVPGLAGTGLAEKKKIHKVTRFLLPEKQAKAQRKVMKWLESTDDEWSGG